MKLGILVLSLFVVTAGQTAQDDVKKELDKLQGNWAVTTFNGQAVPTEAQAFLVFKADKYEQWNSGAVDERGTIKLDPKTKPLSIDLIITEGNDAGKTQPGVYELTAPDSLSIGLATPGTTTRPGAVAQAELQVVLKKVK
ncbi:MAG: TIGR03067 domain-containing protein [Vicinamibacterales bacterium]